MLNYSAQHRFVFSLKPTAFCDRLSDKTKIFKAMFYRDEEKIRVV